MFLFSGFATNKLERRTLNGREYAVAPCVAIVEGVLNGYLVPASEFGAFVEAWNGRPIPLRHPQRNGESVSANSPDVVEAEVVGTVYNATLVDDALHVEFWLDVAKIEQMGGEALDALRRMESGETIEVSTAYWCEIEKSSGLFNGVPYMGIQHHLRPDHIALLPDEIGACSVDDGCGVPRTNGASDVMLALKSAVTLARNMAKGENMEQDELKIPEGETDSKSPFEPTTEVVVEESAEPVVNEAQAEEPVAADPVVEVVEVNGEGSESPFLELTAVNVVALAESVTELVALVAEQSELIKAQQVQIQSLLECREQMAANLEANAQAARDYTDQVIPMVTEVSEAVTQLAARFNASEADLAEVFGAIKALGGAEWLANVSNTVAGFNEVGGATEILTQRARMNHLADTLAMWTMDDWEMMYGFVDFVKQSGGLQVFAETVQGVQVNTRRTKETMIRGLLSNKACAFGKEELSIMSLDMLEKLERSLMPNSYAGRGGERSGGAQEGDGWGPYTPPAKW